MLLCAAQLTLCQEFDCSTKEGQLAFLQRGAETDPGCYNPVIGVLVSDDLPTANQIEDVSDARPPHTPRAYSSGVPRDQTR